jgi:hypothetical protein
MISFQECNTFVAKVISGGQTGADRGGLEAAVSLNILHGGHVPKGRLAEDGAVPNTFQLEETESDDYRVRTRLNVENADVTLLFTHSGGPDGGTLFTKNYAIKKGKPWMSIKFGMQDMNADIKHSRWLYDKLKAHSKLLGRPLIINVAGNRESKCPGIQKRTRDVIMAAFTIKE